MINPQWLKLPISRINFHGPKDVRAIEVRLQTLKNTHGLSDHKEQENLNNIIVQHGEETFNRRHIHYENTSIQIYRKFHLQKLIILR